MRYALAPHENEAEHQPRNQSIAPGEDTLSANSDGSTATSRGPMPALEAVEHRRWQILLPKPTHGRHSCEMQNYRDEHEIGEEGMNTVDALVAPERIEPAHPSAQAEQ